MWSGLLLSVNSLAADFLVEVRVQVERGCMLVNQPAMRRRKHSARSTLAAQHALTAPLRR